MNNYVMNKVIEDFPLEAKEVLNSIDNLIHNDKTLITKLSSFRDRFMKDVEELSDIKEGLEEFSKELSVHIYTIHLYFILFCTEKLLKKYKSQNISEDIFWNTMKDIECKLMECHNVYEIWGVFVIDWYKRIFDLKCFALGRLQFEISKFREDYPVYNNKGITLHPGDELIFVHIPSIGAFTKELRMDSYRKAFSFFGKKPLVLACDSWLLYKDNIEFIDPKSNIIDFMKEFDIFFGESKDTFSDGWRIFGKDFELPAKKLPTNTSLQKAFAKRLLERKPVGDGVGILVFDGTRIL